MKVLRFRNKRTTEWRWVALGILLAVALSGCAHGRSPAVFSDSDGVTSSTVPSGDPFAVLGPPPEGDAAADEAFWDELEKEDEAAATLVSDPLEPWNRAMFQFNDKLYFWLLKPAAQGYRAVTAEGFRLGVRNFFHNLGTPLRFVNCLLQGKFSEGGAELARFAVNSTVGVLGFGDPAGNYPALNPPEEDLGQTLATYGIGNGIYIYWPALGPSTLRDSVGTLGEIFMDPYGLLEFDYALYYAYGIRTLNSTTFRIGDYEAIKEAALDPYQALRDGYIQYRLKKIAE